MTDTLLDLIAMYPPEPPCPRPAPALPFPGVPQHAFAPIFSPVPHEVARKPGVRIPLAERLAPFARPIVAWYGRYDARADDLSSVDLPQVTHHLDYKYLRHFSREELAKLAFGTCLGFEFSDLFNGGERAANIEESADVKLAFRLFGRLRNSAWRWGAFVEDDWNEVVRLFEGVRTFDFGLPGFTTHIDWATHCNEYGYSEHARLFLDGTVGLMIHRHGKHVLTVSVAPAGNGQVMVTQVQLVAKRGNRWLYALPCGLLDHVLDRLAAAFSHATLYLTDGHDLAQRIQASYRSSPHMAPHTPSDDVAARLGRFYGQPLARFARSAEGLTKFDVRFYPLVPLP
jgi:hypothetical protein